MKLLIALGLGAWWGWRTADRRYAEILTVTVGDGETVYRARRIREVWGPIAPITRLPIEPIR